MSRASMLILLGVLVILTPFSGLPTAIRSLLAVIFGACVLGIGLAFRAREVRGMPPPATPAPAPTDLPAKAPSEEPHGVSSI